MKLPTNTDSSTHGHWGVKVRVDPILPKTGLGGGGGVKNKGNGRERGVAKESFFTKHNSKEKFDSSCNDFGRLGGFYLPK